MKGTNQEVELDKQYILNTIDSAPLPNQSQPYSYEQSLAFFKELSKQNSYNFGRLPNIITASKTMETTTLMPLHKSRASHQAKLPSIGQNPRSTNSPTQGMNISGSNLTKPPRQRHSQSIDMSLTTTVADESLFNAITGKTCLNPMSEQEELQLKMAILQLRHLKEQTKERDTSTNFFQAPPKSKEHITIDDKIDEGRKSLSRGGLQAPPPRSRKDRSQVRRKTIKILSEVEDSYRNNKKRREKGQLYEQEEYMQIIVQSAKNIFHKKAVRSISYEPELAGLSVAHGHIIKKQAKKVIHHHPHNAVVRQKERNYKLHEVRLNHKELIPRTIFSNVRQELKEHKRQYLTNADENKQELIISSMLLGNKYKFQEEVENIVQEQRNDLIDLQHSQRVEIPIADAHHATHTTLNLNNDGTLPYQDNQKAMDITFNSQGSEKRVVLTKSHNYVKKESGRSSKFDGDSRDMKREPNVEINSAYGANDSKNSSVVKVNIKTDGITNLSFTNSKIHVKDEAHDELNVVSTQRITKTDKFGLQSRKGSKPASPQQINETLLEHVDYETQLKEQKQNKQVEKQSAQLPTIETIDTQNDTEKGEKGRQEDDTLKKYLSMKVTMQTSELSSPGKAFNRDLSFQVGHYLKGRGDNHHFFETELMYQHPDGEPHTLQNQNKLRSGYESNYQSGGEEDQDLYQNLPPQFQQQVPAPWHQSRRIQNMQDLKQRMPLSIFDTKTFNSKKKFSESYFLRQPLVFRNLKQLSQVSEVRKMVAKMERESANQSF